MKKRLICMISALSLLFTTTYGATVEGIGSGYKGLFIPPFHLSIFKINLFHLLIYY